MNVKSFIKKIASSCLLARMLSLNLLFNNFSVFADDDFNDGIFTYAIDKDSHTATLNGLSGKLLEFDVTIPSAIKANGNEYSVNKIGDFAFDNCSELKVIKISSNITKVGRFAFCSCRKLVSIIIPDMVTSIGDYAFYMCSELKSVQIPDAVTSIGDYAFYSCSKLISIKIPSSATSIGWGAFSKRKNLKTTEIAGPRKAYILSYAPIDIGEEAFGDGEDHVKYMSERLTFNKNLTLPLYAPFSDDE
jgi:hypothetical protein